MSLATHTPGISIITVVLNGAAALETTIESVYPQNRSLYEYLVVDGGSTDTTSKILQKHDASIDRWISEPDSGIYDAMNKGLAMARGEWVYFLNCGDTFYGPDVLSHASKLLKQCETDILAGSVVARDDCKTTGLFPLQTNPSATARELFASRFCHQALFVRRAAYNRVGGFNVKYPHFADFDACWRIIKESGGFDRADLLIANFHLDGITSDYRRSTRLYREAECLFHSFGEKRTNVGYAIGYCRAIAFRYKMALLAAAK